MVQISRILQMQIKHVNAGQAGDLLTPEFGIGRNFFMMHIQPQKTGRARLPRACFAEFVAALFSDVKSFHAQIAGR